MHVARRIFVLLLVILWAPALLHCRLEAAGFGWGVECCNEPAPPADACHADSCDVAEGDFVPLLTFSLAAAPHVVPLLETAVALPPLALADVPRVGLVDSTAAPPEIAQRWVFHTRAALSPRAPDRAL